MVVAAELLELLLETPKNERIALVFEKPLLDLPVAVVDDPIRDALLLNSDDEDCCCFRCASEPLPHTFDDAIGAPITLADRFAHVFEADDDDDEDEDFESGALSDSKKRFFLVLR